MPPAALADLGCNTYSPEGRIFQIEYAAKAVENSGSLIGIKCVDGVVLGVEKLVLNKLLVEGSGRRNRDNSFSLAKPYGSSTLSKLNSALAGIGKPTRINPLVSNML